jgi:AAA+ superfamily predicted ATPase
MLLKNNTIIRGQMETIMTKAKNKTDDFLLEVSPQKKLDDLILPEAVKQTCDEVIQEHQQTALLREHGLEPRNRLLFVGSSGNGKTSLAEALAEALAVPLLVVSCDQVIGGFLGETANRLHKLIEHACARKSVLFFDEFETLGNGKERDDIHENGEIKRVVSSLLMLIDSLPSHVVVIGATNHPEMLDRATWRRFQIRVDLPEPTIPRIEKWLERFQQRLNINLDYASENIAKKLYGLNFSDIEEFGETVFRRYILEQPNSNIKKIISRAIAQWVDRFECPF